LVHSVPRWSTAKVLSEADLNLPQPRRTWALANLIELYLLSQLTSPPAAAPAAPLLPWPDAAEARRQALAYAEELGTISERGSLEVQSLRRQITRYVEWFNDIAEKHGLAQLAGLAEEILTKLPDWSKP